MKRERTVTFDPKAFLSKITEGHTLSNYRKDQIVYTQGDTPALATGERASPPVGQPPSKTREEPILTECKDGSVSVGGDCRK